MERLVKYNEPEDGPQTRLRLDFTGGKHAIILITDASFKVSLEDLCNKQFTDDDVDFRCLSLDLAAVYSSNSALSSYVLATNGRKLVIPLENSTNKEYSAVGLVITGKQFLRNKITKASFVPKDVPTEFVSDEFGDSYNDNFFKEPRVIEHYPETVLKAIDDLLAISKAQFKQGNMKAAFAKYKKAFHYVHSYYPENLEDNYLTKVTIAKFQAALNLALVALKLRDFPVVLECTDFVLDMPEIKDYPVFKAKALYRKGAAILGSGDEEQALELLLLAKDLHPDAMVETEIKKCYDARERRRKKASSALKGAFA